MKKYVRNAVCVCLALCTAATLGACGNNYAADAVVVYAEYNGALGTDDAAVKKAIEDKFEADTGYSISLEFECYGTADAVSKWSNAIDASSSDRIDGFLYHYSSDGPINSAIIGGEAKDITQSAATYAPEFLRYYNSEWDPSDDKSRAYYSGVLDGQLRALSSFEHTSAWAMLVNAELMEQTSFDPTEYDYSDPDCKRMTTEQFLQFLRELKELDGVQRPIQGFSWELDDLIAPAFGAVRYTDMAIDGNGNVVSATATSEYYEYMKYMRVLQGEGLWVENPSSTSADMLAAFMAGKGAIYLEFPEVSKQAEVAQKADFDTVVLAPLVSNESAAAGGTDSNGTFRQYAAFMGLVLPNKTEQEELLLRYVNWLYSDVENYELAKYGIEGEHWVKAGDGYWDYPQGKAEQFAANKPYSGVYCLLDNYQISDRVFNGFTAQQKEWIANVRADTSFPADGCATEGVLLPPVSAAKNSALNTADYRLGRLYTSMVSCAWTAQGYTDAAAVAEGTDPIAAKWTAYRDGVYGDYAAVMRYNTDNYNRIIAGRV